MDIAPQNTESLTMKRSNVDTGSRLTNQLNNAFPHFIRSFVGERHRQNVPWSHACIDEVSDPIGDNPGLAGTGPSKHEKRAHYMINRNMLLRVQSTYIQ